MLLQVYVSRTFGDITSFFLHYQFHRVYIYSLYISKLIFSIALDSFFGRISIPIPVPYIPHVSVPAVSSIRVASRDHVNSLLTRVLPYTGFTFETPAHLFNLLPNFFRNLFTTQVRNLYLQGPPNFLVLLRYMQLLSALSTSFVSSSS
jgi:hypothetical protein